jgi:hypothetical protein
MQFFEKNNKDMENIIYKSFSEQIENIERILEVDSSKKMLLINEIKKISVDKKLNRPFVNLWKENKPHIRKPHKLVLEAFVSICPAGLEGCHNDGNAFNNHIENLRWDTHKNNILDKFGHNTSNSGERCNWAKLKQFQVDAIRNDNRLQRIIAEEYGVKQSLISRIKNGVRWKHH